MLSLKVKGFCHICNKPLRFLFTERFGILFCNKHERLLDKLDWQLYKTYDFHAEDEKAATLEDLRLEIYSHYKIPSFTKFSYREEGEKLITQTELFVPKNKVDEFKKEIKKGKL